jgi:predicted 3-demethylubiquinone-9 3-methyltransferase (glyoxalase superfamily)
MRYMMLIYSDESAWTEEERQQCYKDSTELTHKLNASGQFVGASPLQPVATATTVQVRNGKRLITDGPFAETREQLGGYYMVDAANLDEAISIASQIPPAKKGTVEIRPVVDLPGLPQVQTHRITPFLWFNDNAEEAVNLYTSIFRNSRIESIQRYGDAGPGPKGQVMALTFQLEGQRFMALNGGPHYSFTPAISLFVDCNTQEEVDALWNKLSEGGQKNRCGWLQDKYGLSWQIIPKALGKLMSDPDASKSNRVMQAMLKMEKIEIEGLQKAYKSA